MTKQLQTVIDAAERLSPDEQLELIATVSRALRKQYHPQQIAVRTQGFAPADSLPAEFKRTAPVQDLSQLKADFWPADETADDINEYIAQQRREDLLREQNEYGAA
jgi:hypothetical protein